MFVMERHEDGRPKLVDLAQGEKNIAYLFQAQVAEGTSKDDAMETLRRAFPNVMVAQSVEFLDWLMR